MNKHNIKRRDGPLFTATFNTIAEPLFNTKQHYTENTTPKVQNRKYKLLQHPLVNFPKRNREEEDKGRTKTITNVTFIMSLKKYYVSKF